MEETDLIKTKEDKDFTDTVVQVYKLINGRYGNTARITSMFELFKTAYGLKEFLIFDPKYCQNGNFDSWLIDQQIKWMNGSEVNLSEVYRAILKAGQFTGFEKRIFESGHAPERIWAIFLAVCDPNNSNNF